MHRLATGPLEELLAAAPTFLSDLAHLPQLDPTLCLGVVRIQMACVDGNPRASQQLRSLVDRLVRTRDDFPDIVLRAHALLGRR